MEGLLPVADATVILKDGRNCDEGIETLNDLLFSADKNKQDLSVDECVDGERLLRLYLSSIADGLVWCDGMLSDTDAMLQVASSVLGRITFLWLNSKDRERVLKDSGREVRYYIDVNVKMGGGFGLRGVYYNLRHGLAIILLTVLREALDVALNVDDTCEVRH